MWGGGVLSVGWWYTRPFTSFVLLLCLLDNARFTIMARMLLFICHGDMHLNGFNDLAYVV